MSSQIQPGTSQQTANQRASIPQTTCPEKCTVCGDKASGYHYEVGACCGCKTFFRRSIQAERRYECREDGRCTDERVRCRFCRFNRCVDAGMNPLSINSVPNPAANALVCEILEKRGISLPDSHANQPSSSQSTSLPLVPSRPVESTIDSTLRELLFLEAAHQKLRRSRYNPDPHDPSVTMDWVLQEPSRMGLEYGDMPVPYPLHPLHTPYIPVEIRLRDRLKYPPKKKDFTMIPTYKKWTMIDLIYTIEWIKTFSFFQKLTERERRVHVKSMSRMVALFTAAFWSYDEKRSEITVMPDGMILVQGELPKEANMDRAYYFEIVHRIRVLRMDKQEYVLLKGVLATEAYHENFSDSSRTLLQNQRECFTKALFSYLLARRGSSEGPSTFTTMMSLVGWLNRLIRRSKDLHLLMTALGLKGATIPVVMDELFSP